jgi:prepilin peptidase CpaA
LPLNRSLTRLLLSSGPQERTPLQSIGRRLGVSQQVVSMMQVAVLTVLPAAVAFAAAMDLFTMKIPNPISVLLVLGFFPMAVFAGLDPWSIADHLGAGVLMLVVGVLLFLPGWFGGGDAKLMAAIGLWIGADNLLTYMLYVALAGGLIAMVFFSVRAVPLPRALLGEAWALRLHGHGSGIPYGLALAGGALLVYPHTVWFTALGG